jgi:hypothetical protein
MQIKSVKDLIDAGGENGEAETWFELAHNCGYLSKDDHAVFTESVMKSVQCSEA